MKKRLCVILMCLASVFSVTMSKAQNCPEEYVYQARTAVKDIAYRVMKEISPNTGIQSSGKLLGCQYDALNGWIVFEVQLTWSAKECVLCSDRRQCEVWGEIRISDTDSKDFTFQKIKTNYWTEVCVKSRKWDVLEGAVNSYLNSVGN